MKVTLKLNPPPPKKRENALDMGSIATYRKSIQISEDPQYIDWSGKTQKQAHFHRHSKSNEWMKINWYKGLLSPKSNSRQYLLRASAAFLT